MINLRERLALWIEQKLPRPQLSPGANGRPRGPVKRIIVFGRMPNPTFDYYFAARLDAPGMPSSEAVDIRHGKFDQMGLGMWDLKNLANKNCGCSSAGSELRSLRIALLM